MSEERLNPAVRNGFVAAMVFLVGFIVFSVAQEQDRKKNEETERKRINEQFRTVTGVAPAEPRRQAPDSGRPAPASTPVGSFQPAQDRTATTPQLQEPLEKMAKPGTYRGTVVVCNYGEIPRAQVGAGGKPRAICLKLSETEVVKAPWRPNNSSNYRMSTIYMNGQGYPVDYLNIGDLIEVKVEKQGYDGPMISEGRLLHRRGW
jgi:hypothetical protein